MGRRCLNLNYSIASRLSREQPNTLLLLALCYIFHQFLLISNYLLSNHFYWWVIYQNNVNFLVNTNSPELSHIYTDLFNGSIYSSIKWFVLAVVWLFHNVRIYCYPYLHLVYVTSCINMMHVKKNRSGQT